MNFVEKYSKYIRNNPNNYWFKRRVFGYGWIPVKKEGWLTILVFGLFMVGLAIWFGRIPQPTTWQLATFFIKLGAAVVVLLWICFWKGEKLRWQCGFPKDKN